ncbi:hypothetical protein B7P43_G08559, partial [Cryptotermes secundus]
EIHCELCAVYDQNAVSEGTVRQWRKMFKGGQTNAHDEERSNDLVDQKFTISELSCEFPQISRTFLYEIITVKLGYHKFCARRVPKMRSKQWIYTYTHSPNKSGKFKETMSDRWPRTFFWARKGGLMVEFMQQRDHKNARGVMWGPM